MFICKRYQVCTYSRDIGADDKMDFDTIKEAIKSIPKYLKTEEEAYIYDSKRRSVRHGWNGDPRHCFNDWVDTSKCIMHYTKGGARV